MEENKKTNKILVVAIILVSLLAIGLGTYIYLDKSGIISERIIQDDPKPNPKENITDKPIENNNIGLQEIKGSFEVVNDSVINYTDEEGTLKFSINIKDIAKYEDNDLCVDTYDLGKCIGSSEFRIHEKVKYNNEYTLLVSFLPLYENGPSVTDYRISQFIVIDLNGKIIKNDYVKNVHILSCEDTIIYKDAIYARFSSVQDGNDPVIKYNLEDKTETIFDNNGKGLFNNYIFYLINDKGYFLSHVGKNHDDVAIYSLDDDSLVVNIGEREYHSFSNEGIPTLVIYPYQIIFNGSDNQYTYDYNWNLLKKEKQQ